MYQILLWLVVLSAFVLGSMVGVLLYPRPTESLERFLLLVLVGMVLALVLLYAPCFVQGVFFHRVRAALAAISLRRLGVSFFARALPPNEPRD